MPNCKMKCGRRTGVLFFWFLSKQEGLRYWTVRNKVDAHNKANTHHQPRRRKYQTSHKENSSHHDKTSFPDTCEQQEHNHQPELETRCMTQVHKMLQWIQDIVLIIKQGINDRKYYWSRPQGVLSIISSNLEGRWVPCIHLVRSDSVTRASISQLLRLLWR